MKQFKKNMIKKINVLQAFSLIALLSIGVMAQTNRYDKEIDSILSKSIAPLIIQNQRAQILSSLSNGLVSHYKMDENSGTTVLDSANNANGNLVGNPTRTTGKVAGALSFNGTSQYVDIPNFNSLNGVNSASISFWVKPTADSKPFISKWGTGRLFEVRSNGNSISTIWRIGGSGSGGSSLNQTAPGATITNGVWQHVVVVYNSPSSTIYVNGNQVSSVNGVGGSLNTGVNDPLRIGWNNIPSYFSGEIDDVRVYNRAITAQEISNLYSNSGGIVSVSTPVTQPISNVTPITNSVSNVTPVKNAVTEPTSQTEVSAGCAGTSTRCVPEEYPTIQACANAAVAGDTCLVSPGNYPEQVMTKANGTSDSNRITFKSQTRGAAIIQGIDIRNQYNTFDGFDITGPSVNQQYVGITKGGDYCKVINNYIHDGKIRVQGIQFWSSSSTGGVTANNCLIKGNKLSRLNSHFLTTGGENNRFEENTFEEAGGWDIVRLFGKDHVFYRNIFRNSVPVSGIGNHPDFLQTFFDNGGQSMNMLFEENWIENLSTNPNTGYQMGQMNSGGAMIRPRLSPDFKDFTFRRNVFANIGNNWNLGVPGVRFENNTFYRAAYDQNGLVFGGSLTRGESSRMTILSNAFISGGSGNNTQGFYSNSGFNISQESLRTYVTSEVVSDESSLSPIAKGILTDLTTNGYTSPNGRPTAKSRTLTSVSSMTLSSSYEQYRNSIFEHLRKAIEIDDLSRSTFVANYNFVAGLSGAGYPAKRSDGCTDGINTSFRFCEPNGVNGGDPKLKNINDPDGPDNIPFTTDDGLKPVSDSPLCGKGLNGVDIGVYSCDPSKVFATGNSGVGGIVPNQPPVVNPPTVVNPPVVQPPVVQPPVIVNPTQTNILYVSPTGNDTNTGKIDAPFKTIQRCANVVKAGEMCLVYAGTYPEQVETLNNGAINKYITFKAQGKVTMKGFRIKNPYVRIEGFDITKYDVGQSQGHIVVEPEADSCQLINNTIRDGIYLFSRDFRFDANTRTITNPSGGFIAAGFVPGITIYIGSNINRQILNHDNNSAVPYKYETKKVIAVTDTTLTLDPSNTVFTEGPVPATIYSNKAEKNGVWGIIFNSITNRGQANSCLIQGNTLSNLAGRGLQVHGSNHIIERNTFEKMNGWRMFSFFGDNNTFRYNVFKDSPRWPDFELPKPGTVFSLGSGSWDMYDALIGSSGAIDQTVNNNIFEYNFIKDVDEQLATVSEAAPTAGAIKSLENKGLFVRNNVFINVEMIGSFGRPDTIVSNNTFYKSARISRHNFVIGKGNNGDPKGSVIKNNVFLESGNLNGTSGDDDKGWYSVRAADGQPSPGVIADYNYVAGPASQGFPAKKESSFRFGNIEVNGINGGDPKMKNLSNPFGPDGSPFTSDDGLIPGPASRLCNGGEGGTYIGAYPCPGVSVPNPVNQSDNVPPVITSITTSALTTTGVVISWNTNELSDSQIEYGLTSAYGNSTSLNTALVSSHSQILNGLKSNTTYHYRVKSKDSSGNLQVSNDQTFITKNEGFINNPVVDADGDGVENSIDKCVNTRPGESVNKKGCPLPRVNKFTISDISNEDLNAMVNFELSNASGKIAFKNGNFTLVKSNGDSLDVDAHLTIGNRKVVLDSSKIPELNKPATVTLFNVTVSKPKIIKDGVVCDACVITSYSNGTITFTVPGFSTYEVVDESAPVVSNQNNNSNNTQSPSSSSGSSRSSSRSSNSPFLSRNLLMTFSGDDVRLLQIFLNNQGYTVASTGPGSKGNESNYFGPATRAAVMRFQQANGFVANGIVDGATLTKINSLGISNSNQTVQSVSIPLGVSSGYTFTKSLTVGDRGDDVRELQVFLNNRGYTVSTTGPGSKGNESTFFGPATRSALIRYQLANQISPALGFFGPVTRAKVNLQK